MKPTDQAFDMTVIDLLMLHAPYPAPTWFEPNMRAYQNLQPGTSPSANEVDAWDKLVERERCLQWPLFWAQQQVARSMAGPAQFTGPITAVRKTRRTK